MKVYKCYYLWNGKKTYLARKDRTDIFVSLKGLKASITQREKNRKMYLREKYYARDKYYIETYNLTLEKVVEE